jgi:membrane protein EpsK
MTIATSESRRAIVRIGANYLRLFATVLLGLALVRVLLHAVGSEAVGLISLVGSTIGFTTLMEEVVGSSMIREVGIAYHSRNGLQLQRMYNSAIIVSALASLITLMGFLVLLAILPWLRISPELLVAARWFVIAKAVENTAGVLLAPQYNMYLVTERMVAYNAWFTARRAALLLAALALFWIRPADVAAGLVWFGWLSSGLVVLTMIASAIVIVIMDRRLIPAPFLATREYINTILKVSGWNIGVLVSKMAGTPAGAVIMNLAFGLHGNLVYGLAIQFAGYARMLASGMTGGIEAVAARLSSTHHNEAVNHSMRLLLNYSTRLHALVMFPAAVGMGVLAEPFLQIWVGPGLIDNPEALPQTVVLVRILLAAFVSICFSENWIRILYGAGHINRYAPVIVFSGLLMPVMSVILLLALPKPAEYTAVSWAISLVYVVVHVGVLPRVAARAFGMRTWESYAPLVPPALLSIACAPILLIPLWRLEHWSIWMLALAAVVYAVAYTAMAWVFALNPAERSRLISAGGRRLSFLGRKGPMDIAAIQEPSDLSG